MPRTSEQIDGALRVFAHDKAAKGDERSVMLLDLSVLGDQLDRWKVLLPRVHPYYAVKCNDDRRVLAELARLGTGFDCASPAEIDTVLSLHGVTPDRIVFANPIKSPVAIRHASKQHVHLTTFDSIDEVKRILAHHTHHPKLLLRIAYADPSALCQLNKKFGIAPGDEAEKLLEAAHKLGAPVVGVAFHVGSLAREPPRFMEAIEEASKLFRYARKHLGLEMTTLDIGGGFPGDQNSLMVEIAYYINKALDNHFADVHKLRVIAEPGRYFVSRAGTLLTRVLAHKTVSRSEITENKSDKHGVGRMLYIADGHFGVFNAILNDHARPRGRPLSGDDEDGESVPTTIWGPTCDSLDLVEKNVQLSQSVESGHYLVYADMGAYTLSTASEFNGFARPECRYLEPSV